MRVYLVDRDLPGITREGLAEIQQAEISASQQLTAVAEHRYTIVATGQLSDTSHKPLVIDETAAFQAIGASPTVSRSRSIISKGWSRSHSTRGAIATAHMPTAV